MKYGLNKINIKLFTQQVSGLVVKSSIPSLGSKDQTSQMTLLRSMMEYWLNIPYLIGAYLGRLGGLLSYLN
jgi:hypothetical protein